MLWKRSQRHELSNCLELPVGELDNGLAPFRMCKWKGTLWKDRKIILWSNCTSNRCIFHNHIFSSSQVPMHSAFGRELLTWEMCYPFCSQHKAQEAAIHIYNVQLLLQQNIPRNRSNEIFPYVCVLRRNVHVENI